MNSTSGFFNLILPSKPVYLNELIVSLGRSISNKIYLSDYKMAELTFAEAQGWSDEHFQ